jgi:hypothetical protein
VIATEAAWRAQLAREERRDMSCQGQSRS